MPQVFGSDDLDLINRASLWTEAAVLEGDPRTSDLFSQFADQEGFKLDKPTTPSEQAAAKGRIVYSSKAGLGPKTMKNQPPKYDRSSGELLNGDGYHELVVHLDPTVPEGARETNVGGKRRYELSYHHVDSNGQLHPQTIWAGNTPHGLNNAHERFKAAMSRMR